MPFPRGVIDNDQLDIMQQAMSRACEELGVTEANETDRQRLAFLVTGFMRAGEHDPEKLTTYVVKQFKSPAP
jgi:hypothetical protein